MDPQDRNTNAVRQRWTGAALCSQQQQSEPVEHFLLNKVGGRG